MLSSRVDDTRWVDSFDIPSIFDPRLPLYKEWHDFVFFDRSVNVFGLLNFAIHGNPYDARRGYGAALAFIVDSSGKVEAALNLIPLDELKVSPFSPEFIGGKVSVTYKPDNSFSIVGDIDEISFDLDVPVVEPPVTMSQIGFDILSKNRINVGMLGAAGDMAKVWDKWVELPKLGVSGTLKVNGSTYFLETDIGYQDHEAGRFDWGTVAGWDTGVLLCDAKAGDGPEKVSFLLYRYGPSGGETYGGVLVKVPNAEERFFDTEVMTVAKSGEFTGQRAFLPGVTRLLYPDYHPEIPAEVVFSGSVGPDKVRITFVPKAVCTIVVAGLDDEAETTFNEMYCRATLDAEVAGHIYHKEIPCWFESVRPRGKLMTSGP